MKHLIKLMLLAALAFSGWTNAASQDIKRLQPSTENNPSVRTDVKEQKSLEAAEPASMALGVLPKTNLATPSFAPTKAGGDAANSGVYEENVPFAVNICRGRTTNRYIPACGQYFNRAQKTTMIYPASLVGLSKGDVISSLTFYIDEFGFDAQNQVRLTISETNATTYSDNNTYTNVTLCYSGQMPTGSNYKLTFNLSPTYTYDGGNLVIQLERVQGNKTDDYNAWFYGINATSGSSYSTYSNAGGAQSFLPQLTIHYASSKARVSGNKEFFSGISYNWQDDEGTHTSTLDQIATKPDQIIAMLREVYTNKSIPGNYQRGYSQTGELEDYIYNDVSYAGLGKLGIKTINNQRYVGYNDTYGWNVGSDDEVCNAGLYTVDNYQYGCFYMNPTQYKPDYDGLTLLLLETVDEYDPDAAYKSMTETSGYAQLKEYISKTIKSARIITEAKRTGNVSDKSSGTLFKIDCDKMNEFYLVSKGQLRWLRSAYYENIDGNSNSSLQNFYEDPCFWIYYNNGYDTNYMGYSDADIEVYYLLGHMFEQFSPVDPSATAGQADLYREMVDNMNSFGVKHDCVNVPYIGELDNNNAFTGNVFSHHFRMYGEGSSAADCADVRDMMFFVPDFRMNYSSVRGQTMSSNSSLYFQDYYNYANQPKMGMFVIHQDDIPDIGACGTNYKYWKHQLKWRSNLDNFLPSDEQHYELWEVVVDEFGVESYVPVYYRDENGNYLKADGSPSDTPVPIIINKNDSHLTTITDNEGNKWLVYSNVVVERAQGSQTKTYVIRGRDAGVGGKSLLSLQMSNQQEIFIPGLDENEKARLIAATYYSRYNPQTEKNCYSNRMELPNNGMALTSADLSKTLKFYRMSRVVRYDENGNVVTDENEAIVYDAIKELFATGTFDTGTKKLNIQFAPGSQADEEEFPAGALDVKNGTVDYRAGYHGNDNMSFSYIINNQDIINFVNSNPCRFWDNFTVDVSQNRHPRQYLYKMEVVVGENLDAYSNEVRVPVYKTEMAINNKRTLAEVQGDTGCNDQYTPGETVEIDEQIQLSSKTEILRYDAYRWRDPVQNQSHPDDYLYRYIVNQVRSNDDEQDLPPTGIAQNQGDYYTVTMNDVEGPAEYYYAASGDEIPTVSTGAPYNTATFVDKYPAYKTTPAASYTYAPVVELITKGFDVNGGTREDYNTYGAPLQNVAVGKLALEIDPDLNQEGHAFMSRYKWRNEDGDWFAYYNIPIKFTALNVPAGYEIYKVRAWREVSDPSILGEEYPSRQGRCVAKYLYEDMNFGEDMGGAKSMSKDNLFGVNGSYALGSRPINPGDWFEVDENEGNISGETHATFGAKRIASKDDAEHVSLDNLNATFKVRVYFTKNENPIINHPIYVLGNQYGSNDWDPTTAMATLNSTDGLTYTGHISATDSGDGYGCFSFTTQLASPTDENPWNSIAPYRFGGNTPEWVDGVHYPPYSVSESEINNGEQLTLEYWGGDSRAFRVPVGTYNLKITMKEVTQNNSVTLKADKLIITKANAPSSAPRRGAMTAEDYDYYIAEGEVPFTSSGIENIITGISAVKQDVNREVVGVSYVNTIGQVSSTPWQGVNMVVTRYSDGSTTTKKVIK